MCPSSSEPIVFIPTLCPVPHCTAHLDHSARIPGLLRRSTELEDELREQPASFGELSSWQRDWLERRNPSLTKWTESVGEVRRRPAAG